MNNSGLSCHLCPLHMVAGSIDSSFVKVSGGGLSSSFIYFVLYYPYRDEIGDIRRSSRYRFLRRYLEMYNLYSDDDIYFSYVVRCCVSKSLIFDSYVKTCITNYFFDEIKKVNPELVVISGLDAYNHIFDEREKKISNLRGKIFKKKISNNYFSGELDVLVTYAIDDVMYAPEMSSVKKLFSRDIFLLVNYLQDCRNRVLFKESNSNDNNKKISFNYSSYTFIDSVEKFREVVDTYIELYQSNNLDFIFFDIETSSLDARDENSELLCLSFCSNRSYEFGFVSVLKHKDFSFSEFERKEILKEIIRLISSVPVAGHFVKFDLVYIYKFYEKVFGEKVNDVLVKVAFDTGLASYLLCSDIESLSLKSLVYRVDKDFPFSFYRRISENEYNFDKVSLFDLIFYSSLDVKACYLLYCEYKDKILNEFKDIFGVLCDLVRVVIKIELNGMYVNESELLKVDKFYRQLAIDSEKKIKDSLFFKLFLILKKRKYSFDCCFEKFDEDLFFHVFSEDFSFLNCFRYKEFDVSRCRLFIERELFGENLFDDKELRTEFSDDVFLMSSGIRLSGYNRVSLAFFEKVIEKIENYLEKMLKDVIAVYGEGFLEGLYLLDSESDELWYEFERKFFSRREEFSLQLELLRFFLCLRKYILSFYYYRFADRVLSYIFSFRQYIEADRCIRSTFSFISRTGRLTSFKPNVHSIPSYLRSIFTSRYGEDGLICEADLSQAELRVLAFVLSKKFGDNSLLSLIDSGQDVYVYIGKKFFTDFENHSDFYRKKVKNFFYAFIYGQNVQNFSKEQNLGIEDALAFYELLYSLFPSLRLYKSFVFENLSQKEFNFYSILGRKKVFYQDKEHRSYRQALNYVFQSSVSDILYFVLVKLDEFISSFGKKICIVNTVHDSIILDIHKEELDKVLSFFQKDVVVDIYEKFGINFCFNIRFGKDWSSIF